jgi:hypothetical protein
MYVSVALCVFLLFRFANRSRLFFALLFLKLLFYSFMSFMEIFIIGFWTSRARKYANYTLSSDSVDYFLLIRNSLRLILLCCRVAFYFEAF